MSFEQIFYGLWAAAFASAAFDTLRRQRDRAHGFWPGAIFGMSCTAAVLTFLWGVEAAVKAAGS